MFTAPRKRWEWGRMPSTRNSKETAPGTLCFLAELDSARDSWQAWHVAWHVAWHLIVSQNRHDSNDQRIRPDSK